MSDELAGAMVFMGFVCAISLMAYMLGQEPSFLTKQPHMSKLTSRVILAIATLSGGPVFLKALLIIILS